MTTNSRTVFNFMIVIRTKWKIAGFFKFCLSCLIFKYFQHICETPHLVLHSKFTQLSSKFEAHRHWQNHEPTRRSLYSEVPSIGVGEGKGAPVQWGPMSGTRAEAGVSWGPSLVRSNASWARWSHTCDSHKQIDRQTQLKNISFPQLRWQAVITL